MTLNKAKAFQETLGSQLTPHLIGVGIGIPGDKPDAPVGLIVLIDEDAPRNVEENVPQNHDGDVVYVERIPRPRMM